MEHALTGKRVLITQATEFMGPALCDIFTEQGAAVVASSDALLDPDAAERVVCNAGRIDVLVANLALRAPSTAAVDVTEAEWRGVFAALVDPLPRLFAATLPSMIARREGKILVIGSASGLTRELGRLRLVSGPQPGTTAPDADRQGCWHEHATVSSRVAPGGLSKCLSRMTGDCHVRF